MYVNVKINWTTNLFCRESLIHAEMLAVEKSERKISHELHAVGDVLPHQINPEQLVRPGKGDGPSVVAAAKFLGRHVPVQVPRNRLGHDERENAAVGTVVEPDAPEQQRHLDPPTRPAPGGFQLDPTPNLLD